MTPEFGIQVGREVDELGMVYVLYERGLSYPSWPVAVLRDGVPEAVRSGHDLLKSVPVDVNDAPILLEQW